MHWNHTLLIDLTIKSRDKGIYIAKVVIFYLFALKIKENNEWRKEKYFWKITEYFTLTEIIFLSLKCIEIVFFLRKYQVLCSDFEKYW